MAYLHLVYLRMHNALGVQASCLQRNCQNLDCAFEPGRIVAQGKDRDEAHASNISSVWGIWDCHPYEGQESRSA